MRDRLRNACLPGLGAVALALSFATALLPDAAHAQAPTLDPRYTTLYSYVGGRHTTCFWYYGPVSGGAGDLNIAYPDANAYYWAAYFRRPAGSTLKLRARYPHTRYYSIVSYNAASAILDGIYDAQFDPDPDGSVNPYRPGGDRDSTLRNYSINVVNATNPGFPIDRVYNDQAPRNDLYARSNPNSSETLNGVTEDIELLMWRTYVPDGGADPTGNVGLPEPELTLADGTVLTGQALCDRVDSQSVAYKAANAGRLRLSDPNSLLINRQAWQALRYPDQLTAGCNVLSQTGCPTVLPANYPPVRPQQTVASTPLVQLPWDAVAKGPLPAHFPATLPNTWRATYTRRYLLQMYTGNDAPGAETAPIRFTGGVFFPNPHNNYARTVVNRKLGKVAVFRGKNPVTPTTVGGDATWTTDPVQARYASYCISESLRTTRVMDCTFDEEMPMDADRRFTLAVSRIEDRPSNATKFCGVAWLEWWPTGDGALVYGDTHYDQDFGWLGIRHMLPERSFAEAIQNTQTPGDEKAVMGDYLPEMSYETDASAFEQNVGCAWAQPGRPQLAAGGSAPNAGSFALEWAPTRDAGEFSNLRYTLQRSSTGGGGWSDVATELASPSYALADEAEGTWIYRVSAREGTSQSSWSADSREILVDRTAPSLSVTCPATALLNSDASATVTASDAESGLAFDPSGASAIDTSTVGATTTTATATDNVGHGATESCTTRVLYAYSGLLQPVNADGSSIFKRGSTVPLKFTLADANGAAASGASAVVYVAKVTDTIEGSYVEATSTSAADAGNAFRETDAGSYQYNLSTKGLTVGTWSVKVVLGDGASYVLPVSLR